MAKKKIGLAVVEDYLEEIKKSYSDSKPHLYIQLKEFVGESGGMDVFTDEARQWINDKYDVLLGQ